MKSTNGTVWPYFPANVIQGITTLCLGCLLSCSQGAEETTAPNVIAGPLSPLYAVADEHRGGRLVDGQGREVLLRGANVNSLGEYWQYDEAVAPTFPLVEEEIDLYAGIGWNVVRLLLSWSKVEPSPGNFDEAYLQEVESAVLLFESRGVYTIIDLHQDAWGPALAAPESQECPEGTFPAIGWDGAPEWATLDAGASRCITEGAFGLREFSPAVLTSFLAFWTDQPGPEGVGVQTRYHAMLQHLAKRFSPYDAVIGYDVMNEPNAWSSVTLAFAAPGMVPEDQSEYLGSFYERALSAIRAGEESANTPNRLFFFEPSPDWALSPELAVLPLFNTDQQVVYAPHIYQGGIFPGDLDEDSFESAVADAALFGGVPILTGEWGAGPDRATDPKDDYFERHLDYQDQYRVSSTLWQFRVGCGDPHAAWSPYEGVDPSMWGLFDVDCPSNQTVGFRDDFAEVLRRPLLQAAPGPIGSVWWERTGGRFEAQGSDAVAGQELVLFLPKSVDESDFELVGLSELEAVAMTEGPGHLWSAQASGGEWLISVVISP